jgi:hypothetical protein
VARDSFDRAAPDGRDGPAASADGADDTNDTNDAVDERRAAVEAGRRRGGVAGAALAGAMLGLRDALEGKPKEEIPIEVEASGEPHDVDRDGVHVEVDGMDVAAPALERKPPVTTPKGRRKR